MRDSASRFVGVCVLHLGARRYGKNFLYLSYLLFYIYPFCISIQFPVSFHTAWQLVTVTVTNDLPGPQNWIKIQLEGLFSSHCPAAGSLSLAVWQIDWWSASQQLKACPIPWKYIFSVASWATPPACLDQGQLSLPPTFAKGGCLCGQLLSGQQSQASSVCPQPLPREVDIRSSIHSEFLQILENSLFSSFTLTCSLSNPKTKRDL